MSIEIGMKGEVSLIVSVQDTAASMGSGTIPVLATPRMAALMEEAAWLAIQGELEDDQTTVGIGLDLSHSAPTPVGMKVRAEAVVTGVEGRVISFGLKAWDERELIGEGSHKRAIVAEERFVRRCYAKGEH